MGGSRRRDGITPFGRPVVVLVPPRVLERVAKMARRSIGDSGERRGVESDRSEGEGALRRGVSGLDARRSGHGALSAGGERYALAGRGRQARVGPGAAFLEWELRVWRRLRGGPSSGRGERRAVSTGGRYLRPGHNAEQAWYHRPGPGGPRGGAGCARRRRGDLQGDRRRLGPSPSLRNLGIGALREGDHEEAVARLAESLTVLQET